MKRNLLVGGAIAALAVVVYTSRHEVVEAFNLLQDVRWQFLAIVPFTLGFSFFSRAKYYQTFAASLGYKLKFKTVYKLTYGVNFVNQISPSAGVTGITFLSANLRRKIPTGKIAFMEYSRYIITHFSFVPILVVGFGLMYFGGGIDKIVVRIVLLIIVAGMIAAGLFLTAIRRRRQVSKIAFIVQSVINKVTGWVRRGKGPLVSTEKITGLLSEFNEGVDFILSNRSRLKKPFFYGLMINLAEVSSLYVSFVAIEHAINPGALIIGYAVANVVGAISIIPGDVGVFEFAMVTAFSGAGIPVAVALSATLIYRILNKAISLPVGLYFYSSSLGKLPAKSTPPIIKKISG